MRVLAVSTDDISVWGTAPNARLSSDILTIALALALWVALGSFALALADGLGPAPVRRVVIGLALVAVSAVALWRRGAVRAALSARPWLVVFLAGAELATVAGDGLLGGPYVAFSLTSVGLAVVAARARTVWLCVAVLTTGYTGLVLIAHSPATLAHKGELGGAIGAAVTYPVVALVLLWLRRRFTWFVDGIRPMLDDMRVGAAAFTPALARAIAAGPRPAQLPPSKLERLTPAERRVVAGLAAGAAPKELARQLGVSLATVRTHIKHAKRKTGARTLRELAAIAAETGQEHTDGR
jgi:DNA-binding CsgD family transcriptional regulator